MDEEKDSKPEIASTPCPPDSRMTAVLFDVRVTLTLFLPKQTDLK